jgi:tetratricopeptide (TPR) repeat protein
MEIHDFEQAVKAFKELLNRSPQGALFLNSYRLISRCQEKLRQYDAAVLTLNNLIKQVDDPNVKDEANYRIGWIYVEIGSFDAARDYFNRIGPQNKTRYVIDRLFKELAKEPLLEKKSPLVAGTLSLVPGLGYLYCDRPRDALVSFLVNGAMIYATYAAIDNGNTALGAILAFVELGFYSANIYGSTTSAHKFNRRTKQDFIETLKRNTRLHLSSAHGDKGVLFALQYRF